ncbi:MAG: WD40 repeat domain-containing serine/threonine protein kinase [Oscillochloridaceae bacterium umkhey_bin13]
MIQPGDLVAQRYQIEGVIGRGGFGAVYKAVDTRLNKPLALKQLMWTDPVMIAHFEREAKLLATLNHPNLPSVSDHFSAGGAQFLVMEYVPGNDLGEVLAQQQGPFPVTEVLAWADQLLDVLTYLHERTPPVIHRDIKPHNLKVTPNGTIKLIDFGLAKADAHLKTSMHAYSLAFSSLEQIQATGTDARSDLYSLAVTLHALLSGQPLPADPYSRKMAHHEGKPDPLLPVHTLNPQVPLHVSSALVKAAQIKPEDRFQRAREFRTALRGEASQTQQHTVIVQGGMHAQSPQLHAMAQPQAHPAPVDQTQLIKRTVGAATQTHVVGKKTVLPQPEAQAITVLDQPAPKPAVAMPAPKLNKQAKKGLMARFMGCLWLITGIALFWFAAIIALIELQPCRSLNRVFGLSTCVQQFATRGELRSLALTTNAQQMLVGSGRSVQVWDIERGALVRTLGQHEGLFGNQVTSVALAPNGILAASGGQDDLVRIWRVRDAVPVHTLRGHTADVRAVAYSPDGRLLASASDDRTVRLWRADAGEALVTLVGHTDTVTSLAFSSDGTQLVSGSDDATVRIWDVNTRRLRLTLQAQAIKTVVFSPDGTLVAAGSSDGRTRLWSTSDGTLINTAEQPHGEVRSLLFRADGTQLVWGTANGWIYVWDIDGGTLQGFMNHGEVRSLTLDAEGETIIAGAKDGLVRQWKLTP